MQTTYNNTVIAAIQYFANAINNTAHDSVVEQNDYSIHDSVECIEFLFSNYTQHSTVNSLANAALSSELDTMVRENIHAVLTEF